MKTALKAALFCVATGNLLIGFGDNCAGADKTPANDSIPSSTDAANPQAGDATQETLTLKGHTAIVFGVAFSSDGKRLAPTSFDGTVKMWDATSGQETLTLNGAHQLSHKRGV